MIKFFSLACRALRNIAGRSIFTKKKIVGFFLLFSFLVGIGLSFPNSHEAFAGNKPLGAECRTRIIGSECASGFCKAPWSSTRGICAVDKGFVGNRIGSTDEIGDALLNALMFLPLILSGIFSWFASETLKWILKFSTETISYTILDPVRNPVVTVGWPIIRDFGNMIIVLSLIVIAIAVILRLEMFGDRKKLLARLIVAALLINFSLVLCGVVIDASNITMKYALLGGKKVPESFLSQNGLKDAINTANTKIGKEESSSTYIARALSKVFFYIINGIVALLFVFLFIFRIVALYLLVILSPLAFACAVLPFTKSLVFDKWRSNFLQWCFIGIFGALFIYLGNIMNTAASPFEGALNSGTDDGLFANDGSGMQKLLLFFLPGAFMIMGFLMSIQLSAMGAKTAIAGALWTRNKAYGIAKGTFRTGAGAVAEKTGLTRLKDNIVDRATRIAERTPILKRYVPPGTANLALQKRLEQESATKETAAATPQQREDIARQALSNIPLVSESARNRVSEAIEQMIKNGEINSKSISAKDRGAMLAFVAKRKGKTDIYSQAGPETAIDDTDKINEFIRTKGMTKSQAEGAVIRDSYAKGDRKEYKEMSSMDLGALANDENAGARRSYAVEELLNRKEIHQISAANPSDPNAIKKALDATQKYGVSSSIYSKVSPDYAGDDADKVNAILAKNGLTRVADQANTATLAQINTAKQEAIKEAYAQKDDKDIKKLSDADAIAKVIQSGGGIDPATGRLRKNVDSEGSQIIDNMAKEGTIGKLAKALGGLDNLVNQINHTTKDFGSNTGKALIKIAPHRAHELDRESVNELVSGGMSLPDAEREVRRKANSKVAARNIKDLDKEALTGVAGMEFIDDATLKVLQKADNLSKDQIDQLQELAKKGGAINAAIMAARAAYKATVPGSPAEAEAEKKVEELRKKRKAIKAMA